jgi:hypothetical protein
MKVSAGDMKKGKRGLTRGLALGILAVLLVACAPPTSALPTADSLTVADSSGDQGTYVVVPVTLTNVQDGPIICIVFDMHYTNSVIEVVGVQNGNLTSFWDSQYNTFTWGTRISLVYDGNTTHGVQDGSAGSLVLLNLSVIGEPGETSTMSLANIQLSDIVYNVGTAPANNGKFSISGSQTTPTPTPPPADPPAGGGGDAPLPDSDGDGYPDQVEWLEETDPNDPNDYPGKTEATRVDVPAAIMPSVSSSAAPSVTPSPTSSPRSQSQTPALRQLSFKTLIAIAGLVAVVCILIRRIRLQ